MFALHYCIICGKDRTIFNPMVIYGVKQCEVFMCVPYSLVLGVSWQAPQKWFESRRLSSANPSLGTKSSEACFFLKMCLSVGFTPQH